MKCEDCNNEMVLNEVESIYFDSRGQDGESFENITMWECEKCGLLEPYEGDS